MNRWRATATRVAHQVDTLLDRTTAHLRTRRSADALNIVPYRWYGNHASLTIRGRILGSIPSETNQTQQNLFQTVYARYQAITSDERPAVPLRATLGTSVVEGRSDHEGYFQLTLPVDSACLHEAAKRDHWLMVNVARPDQLGHVACPVLLPPDTARFGVISDIDDTVLKSYATNPVRVALITLLKDATEREPFEDVPLVYRTLQQAETAHNPIFYVSSSPWNLYDMLTSFMQHHGIPLGPMALRDVGFDADKFFTSSHTQHKGRQIESILRCYPSLPFILVGDSGQHDAEIYADIAKRYRQQVKLICIRNVSKPSRQLEHVRHICHTTSQAGVTMRLITHSQQLLTLAREQHLFT